MASLDDTFEALQHFHRALLQFNEALNFSAAEVREKNAAIEALWTDETARAYSQSFGYFLETMDKYQSHTAPQLEDFLKSKLGDLDRYLHGS